MRRAFVVALLALAACAEKPAPAPIALKPLGPCPASSWKPDAPPPTSSAKVSMVLLAVQEWARFGRQTTRYTANPPIAEQLGIKEREAPERIRDYWKSVDRPHLSGLDSAVPWSAAFISWDIESAGVPRDLFCPDARHTIYVERIVERARSPGAVFIARDPRQQRPQVGDLVCATRDGGATSLHNLDRGPGHCDIVVELRPGEVHAIGGNVGDSVTRSIFPLDASGFLSPLSSRPFFAVIENRLPWE